MPIIVAIFGPGWLGKKIKDYLTYPEYQAFLVTRSFDITKPEKVVEILNIIKPDVVINAAGKTGRPNIDWCELPENRDLTYRVNVLGASLLAAECYRLKIRMIHLSSGCIFDGLPPDPMGFTESDEPNPQSYYAQTKVEAEREVMDELDGNAAVLRLRMPISGDVIDRNLIYKLTHYSRVMDVFNSVTCVDSLLDTIHLLIQGRHTGIFHVVNPGPVYHRDILKWYRKIVDPGFKFEIVPQSEIKTLAGRSNCILQTLALDALGINLPRADRSIKNVLKEYAENLKAGY
jgi:3,5-epimerase/4-reductase